MKQFIQAIFIPSKMRKFRYTTVFVPMLIFVLSIYLITIPHNVYINNNKEKFIDENSYVSQFHYLDEIAISNEIIDAKYKVQDNVMIANNDGKDVKAFSYNSDATVKGEKTNINLHIVFDITSSILDKTNAIQKKFVEQFPEGKYSKSIAYLVYIDELNSTTTITTSWYTERFTYYNGLTDDAIQEIYQSKNNFDLYGIKPVGDNNYLIVFLKDQMITQIPYKESEESEVTYPALTAYYANCNELDFTNVQTLNDFGNALCDSLFKALKETEKSSYLLNAVVYAIIFPALYCLLLFWCMRKRGTMKTYKEYYNVAGIASILPTLVTFICGWFIPNALLIYGIGFSIMTLLAFYKINLTPDQGV